jgi:hypothetical protein
MLLKPALAIDDTLQRFRYAFSDLYHYLLAILLGIDDCWQ